MSESLPLNRSTIGAALTAATAPARLVHLGLGAFHRAHQVWYTQQAEANPEAPEWGYVSFTGRRPTMAEALSPQDGLYTLVTRSGAGDVPELITALVEAQPATNIGRLLELMADPQVAVVSLTVTEAGYHLDAAGELNGSDAAVQDDIAMLTSGAAVTALATAAGKIVHGLAARRAAGAGGLAVMSCDNIAANGETTRASILGMADKVDAELAAWIREKVTFPSTSIDRITPATEAALLMDVEKQTGFQDHAPVVTEPFSSWIIEGDFPAGRPAWEKAGVQFVADIEQFERRKLWLLNGSHSLMAYYGQLLGHTTVADAITDARCRARVEALWDEAARHLIGDGLNVAQYRQQLIERFENPRIVHNLAQIAIDGATKQRMRAVPILKSELAAGRSGEGASFSVAAWIAFVLGAADIRDTRVAEILVARQQDDAVQALIAVLDEDLGNDPEVVERIRMQVGQLS